MTKPLEGLTILAITQYGAGPFAMLHLADLGANVIKIEDRHSQGDMARRVIPYSENNDSLFFQTFNRNHKSITLDLKSAKGKEIFHRLVEKADAVFNNLRGDVPEKLGITYSDLGKINPSIVCCSLSGFGTNSSMKHHPAYDYLFQAMLGHMSLTGEPGGPPTKYGISMMDFSTGVMAALGLMVGIFQAKIKGIGSDVDVSLFDTSASFLNYLATWHLNKGYEPERTTQSAHPTLVPSQLFATKDGNLVIMCNKEKFFPILCEKLGVPELAEDQDFQDFQGRYTNKNRLIPILIEIFKKKTTDEWMNLLSGYVPAAPVNTVKEAMEHPLMTEREMIVHVEHENFGDMKMLGTPIKVSSHRPEYKPGPKLGENNEEVYKEVLGMTEDEIEELQERGVI